MYFVSLRDGLTSREATFMSKRRLFPSRMETLRRGRGGLCPDAPREHREPRAEPRRRRERPRASETTRGSRHCAAPPGKPLPGPNAQKYMARCSESQRETLQEKFFPISSATRYKGEPMVLCVCVHISMYYSVPTVPTEY